MSNAEKKQHYLDVKKRLEKTHNDIISINNSNNPFSDMLKTNPTDIYEVILMYDKFDKLRNSVKSSEKIQSEFEHYLENTEEIISKIRESAKELAETGLKFESIDESKVADFGQMIKKQFIKFKNWIEQKNKRISEIKEMIKEDMAYIEKAIQKEFSNIK